MKTNWKLSSAALGCALITIMCGALIAGCNSATAPPEVGSDQSAPGSTDDATPSPDEVPGDPNSETMSTDDAGETPANDSATTQPEPTESDVPADQSETEEPDPFADRAEAETSANGQAGPADASQQTSDADASSDGPAVADARPPVEDGSQPLLRLVPGQDVWIDREKKHVVLGTQVVLRDGPLELFACLEKTKEHEAIVAVAAKAQTIHTGLLAVGAEPGSPVQFRPEYRPASGTRIDVLLEWLDPETGEVWTATAQEWIQNVQSGEQMGSHWVFGGSAFWEDEVGGQTYYLAEDGDLICVANFHSAMLDIPIESSQANEALMFQAFTERIPPLGTRVWVRLVPVFE